MQQQKITVIYVFTGFQTIYETHCCIFSLVTPLKYLRCIHSLNHICLENTVLAEIKTHAGNNSPSIAAELPWTILVTATKMS